MCCSDSYSVLFMLYRIFGIIPFNFHFQSFSPASHIPLYFNKKRKLLLLSIEKFWTICLLLFELYNLIHSSILWYTTYLTSNNINTFNIFRTMTAVSFRICVITMTIELHCKRHVQVEIFRMFHEIDRIFAQKLQLQINYHRLRRCVVVACLKWLSICILIMSISFASKFQPGKTAQNLRMLLSLYLVLKQIVFGSVYITYVILIRHRIRAIHEVLDRNLLLTQQHATVEGLFALDQRNEYEAFEFRRLVQLWRLFPQVYATVQLVNHTFKWSISIYIFVNVFNFCVVVFDYVREIWGLIDEDGLNTVLYSTSLIFYCMYLFGVIIHMANSVANDGEKIASKIHRVSLCGVSEDLLHFVSRFESIFVGGRRPLEECIRNIENIVFSWMQLQVFSLQQKQQPIYLHLFGFIKLHYGIVIVVSLRAINEAQSKYIYMHMPGRPLWRFIPHQITRSIVTLEIMVLFSRYCQCRRLVWSIYFISCTFTDKISC